MTAQRENTYENLLGLTEYPSSSDDENDDPTLAENVQKTEPRERPAQDPDEVINVDDSNSPNMNSLSEQLQEPTPGPSATDHRREQVRADHNLFWSAVANPAKARLISRLRDSTTVDSRRRASEARSSQPPTLPESVLIEFRTMRHEPVQEFRQPQPSSSVAADMQSLMTFKRFQRYAYRDDSIALLQRSTTTLPQTAPDPSSHPNNRRTQEASSANVGGFVRNSRLSPSGAEREEPEDEPGSPSTDQDDADDNDNQQSEDDIETIEMRLSPRLQASTSANAPDNNSENMDTLDVDRQRNNSTPGDEAGDGEEDSEEEVPTPGGSELALNNDIINDPGNAIDTVDTNVQPRGRKRRRDYDLESNNGAVNIKDFNQNLLRLLECPVCLECMEPPMWQCRRGHLVCGRCRLRLAACPVCRMGFSPVRNRAMEGVAELLHYPCRHGCGRSARLRRRPLHEASCPARRFRCPAPACAQRAALSLSPLVRHVQRYHKEILKMGHVHKFSVKLNTSQHENWLLMADFGLFNLRLDVEMPTWAIVMYVVFVGPKCRANEFNYEVTATGQYNSRKLVYTRATHSDLESSSLLIIRQDCFNLSIDQAINFLRVRNKHCERDRTLELTVEIVKQEDVNVESNIANALDE